MKVVPLDPIAKEKEKIKADLLEVLDEIRRQVEEGDIVEIVAVSLDPNGDAQIHAKTSDLITAVGLFEMGKHMIIQREAYDFDE